MVWSIVEWIGFSGQVVGLQGKMLCRISSVARLENCASEEERVHYCRNSVGVGMGVNV